MHSFALITLLGLVALSSVSSRRAPAQSPPPPVHSKPHPGVPLVKPDASPDPSSIQEAAGQQAGVKGGQSTAASSTESKTAGSASHPPSGSRTPRPATPAASSKRHISASKTTSPNRAHNAGAGANSENISGARPGTQAAEVTIAQAKAPASRAPAETAQHARPAAPLAPQSGSFTVSQLGHAVGTAQFRLAPSPSGCDSTSTVRVAMQGLNYALSKTEQLDPAHRLMHVLLSAAINNQAVNVTARPDAAQFLLNISANGRSTTTRLASHPALVFLPDFDPGALQNLLILAEAQNGRDLWAIIPKQAGSIQAVQLATYPDERGTLDGNPVPVHHLVATIAQSETDLFVGPGNLLLQAELPQQGFSLILKGFILTPPPKPGAAPLTPPTPQP